MERTETDSTASEGTANEAADLIFVATREDDRSIYASGAGDFAKLCREQGLAVSWDTPVEEREYLALKSADIWLPVVQIVFALYESKALNALASAIDILLALRNGGQAGTVHVTWVIEEGADGRREHISVSAGSGDDAVKPLREFRKAQRDQKGH